MAEKTAEHSGDVISRLADSGEDAVRILIAFPLRVLVGAFDIVDAQVHKVADLLREIERAVESESRGDDSPEKHTASRRPNSRTTSEAT